MGSPSGVGRAGWENAIRVEIKGVTGSRAYSFDLGFRDCGLGCKIERAVAGGGSTGFR